MSDTIAHWTAERREEPGTRGGKKINLSSSTHDASNQEKNHPPQQLFASIPFFILVQFNILENIFHRLQETSGYVSLPKLSCFIMILFFPCEKAYLTEASLYSEQACPEFITEEPCIIHHICVYSYEYSWWNYTAGRRVGL